MKVSGAAVRRFLARPDPACRAVLLYGPNRALSAEAGQALIGLALGGADDPFALTKLSEDEIRKDKARLSDALAARSLLGGATCVWLRIEGESQSEAILAALKEIEGGAERAFFVVEAGEIAGKGKLVGGFEAAGRAAAVAFYEESEAERAAALRAAIEARGVSLSGDGLALFLAEAPADRAAAKAEIEKLALYGHGLGRAIEMEEVAALSIAADTPELDAAVLAATAGDRAGAIERLAQSDVAAVQAIRALQRRVARLVEARLLVEGGVPVGEAGDRLKPKVFWKERDSFAAQLRLWSLQRLRAAQAAVWQAEVRAKTAGPLGEALTARVFARVAELARAEG
jgi:DNA polymerase-3 subunit delta